MLAVLVLAGCAGEAPETPAPEIGPDGLPVIDAVTPLPDPLPEVAGRVNGEDIQIRNVVIIAEARLRRQQAEDRIVAYRRALQEVIARELLLQEALSRGVTPDPGRLQEAYDDARAGHREDADWQAFLAEEGMTEELFRKELRVQHTINTLVEEIAAQQVMEPVSDEQARAFYDENPQLFETGDRYRARHVLIRVAPDAPAQEAVDAMARLNEARRRVVAGEDFAAVAQEFSDDAGSRGKGGEIAVFSRGEVPAKLAEEVAKLQPGDISPAFRSSAGYHFAELLERLPGEQREFDAVREGLKQRLLVQQRQRHIQDFVNGLRAKARIETFI